MTAECISYLSMNQTLPNMLFTIESTKIHETLLTIGIPPNISGYSYLIYAIELITFQPDYLCAMTKKLYPEIARKFNTTPSRVERAMRHAIGTAWLRGDLIYIEEVFRNCVNSERGVPSNSLFLTRMYQHMLTSAR